MGTQTLELSVDLLPALPLFVSNELWQHMNRGVELLLMLLCGEVLGWLMINGGSPVL